MVGPRQGRAGLGRERSRGELHLRRRRGEQVPQQTRPRPHLSGPSGNSSTVQTAVSGYTIKKGTNTYYVTNLKKEKNSY